jgi:2'-5' RNA ligase
VRAFVAVDLDPELKSTVGDLIRRLEAARAEVRWTRPGGFHLTLKFLGEIDDEQIGRVKAALAEVARRHRPFALRLEGTGAFPGPRNPRVLWLGVTAEPGLAEFQDDLERALEGEGFPPEARPFRPHLTLGRVKGRDRLDRALTGLDERRQDDFGGMTVRKIALFESRLRPEGAEYRIVHEAELG